MSQTSGMTGGSFASGARPGSGNKAIPVLLLALAVALGVALLHGLDNTPTVTEASLETTKSAQAAAAKAEVIPSTTTTLAARAPSQVKVLILNGTTVSGVASKINARLQPIGYQLGSPTNTTAPSTETSVQYAAGYETEAKAVADSLGIAENLVKPVATPAPVADTQNSNVIVIIGNELAATTNAATTSASATANGTTNTTVGSTTTTIPAVNQGVNGPLTNSNASSTNGTTNTTVRSTTSTTAVRTN